MADGLAQRTIGLIVGTMPLGGAFDCGTADTMRAFIDGEGGRGRLSMDMRLRDKRHPEERCKDKSRNDFPPQSVVTPRSRTTD